MRRLLLTIITLIAAVTAGSADEYLDIVEQADKAVADERWADAEQLLVSAMQTDPSNSGNILLLSNLGMLRYYMGQDSLALATLNEAHRIAPRSTAILSNRATVLTAAGRIDAAIADYDAIIAVDSMAVEPRFNRGMLRLKQRDIEGAAADMLLLDSIAPAAPQTATGMAALLTARGKFAEAAVRYTRVLESDKQPEFYAARALCYLMTDRLGDAADDIASGLALDPTDGELYLYRAVLNKMRYRPDDAAADAERAVSLGVDPRRTAALLNTNTKRQK